MSKLEKLNQFLNEIDVMGIAVNLGNEYDIEAEILISNFDDSMLLKDVSELFTSCFEHFFFVNHILKDEEVQELSEILKSQ